jgi:hypothetical protein
MNKVDDIVGGLEGSMTEKQENLAQSLGKARALIRSITGDPHEQTFAIKFWCLDDRSTAAVSSLLIREKWI